MSWPVAALHVGQIANWVAWAACAYLAWRLVADLVRTERGKRRGDRDG